MVQLLVWLVVLIGLFYYFAIKPMSYWKEKGVKQGQTCWLLGDNWNIIFRRRSLTETIHFVYNKVPGVRYIGMYQFTMPVLMIKDLNLIKQIGVKDFEYFMDHRSFIPDTAEPLWSKNLFALKGQKWKDMRPILSPSFTSSKMKIIFNFISESAQNFSKSCLKNNEDFVEIEMKDAFTRFANDVIATTAFGIKTDSMAQPDNEFYLMGKDITNFGGFCRVFRLLGYVLLPKLYEIFSIGFLTNNVRKFFTELIEDTVKTREEKGIIRPDMIHLLIEAKKGIQHKEEKVIDDGFAVVKETELVKKVVQKQMTNLDIAAQAMIFFFAGFETVSSLMCFMSYELAVNPDVQSRLRKEIQETLQECNQNVTYEALLRMKYMDMVVSETLRKWPSAITTDRICTKPYTILPTRPDEQPIHVEKGTTISIPIFAIHRDPQHYPHPERFDPERFNDKNKEKINTAAYIPFGIGPRNCIGSRFGLLETKVLFFHLLSHFEITPNDKSIIPLIISKKEFSLAAEGGFPLTLKRLSKQ